MIFTKLHIPQTDERVVHRTELFEMLNNGVDRKLILVSATAGYGKTTLISDWISYNNLSAAWCSIDERDNDPLEFLKIVITAINRKHEEIGKSSLELLNAPGAVSVEYIIELFINDLLQLKNDLVLVLDDLHLITTKHVFDILSAIIDYKPPHLKLIISTRSDPPLAFARLRSQNAILEIRANELGFSKLDISALFNKKLKLGLTEKDLLILEQKTEGWIAGLQLAALTIKGHDDVSGHIKKMAGNNRYIMDYLLEEVLNSQSEEINQFLLCSSILEKLSGSLCDAVLSKNNSQQLLESLEKSNMFLISLDNERKWYRYHHLFGDLLRQRLNIQLKDEIPALEIKASEWYEKNDMPINAIEHSIKAGDKQRAMNLINKIIDRLWETSQYPTILKFGNYFTKEEIQLHTNFCIIYAWSVTITGKVNEAEGYLKYLLDNNVDKKYLGRIYGTFNFIKVFSGDAAAAFKYSELATKNLSEDDIIWCAWAHISHGESHLLRLELEQSIQSYSHAKEKLAKANNIYLNFISKSKTVYVLKLLGKYSEAYSICKNLLDKFLQAKSAAFTIGSSILYSMFGTIKVEQNKVEEGIENAEKGYKLSRNATSVSFKGYCSLLLAEVYYKAGKLDLAKKIIEELEVILDKKSAQWLYVLANSLKSKIHIIDGELEESESLLKLNISSDKNFLFERCYNNLPKARLCIAQNKCDEAINILETLTEELKNEHAIELFIEIELLKAKAYLLEDKKNKAEDSVISAIRYSQSENLIRSFVIEGSEIYEVIKEIKQKKSIRSTEILDSISMEFLNELIKAFEKESQLQKQTSDDVLSSREFDTLKLIAKNLTNQQIADTMYISITTVKTHVRNILLKLEAKNRIEATEIAIKKGLI